MRQVVLDTETTGLEHAQGHRIIEIGCIEVVNRRVTQRTFHKYLCPDREIDEGALRVHGIKADFLAKQPRFHEIAAELFEFIADAELVIHNATFDVGFLDMEFGRLPPPVRKVNDICRVLDTLPLARQMHPGQRNSLDALCKRYSIDNSGREFHGALKDANLLANVYLVMTGGQGALVLDSAAAARTAGGATPMARPAVPLMVVRATDEELAVHEKSLAAIDKASGGRCVWKISGPPN